MANPLLAVAKGIVKSSVALGLTSSSTAKARPLSLVGLLTGTKPAAKSNSKQTNTPDVPKIEIAIDSARQVSSPNAGTLSTQGKEILKKFDTLNKGLQIQVDSLKDQSIKQENAIKEARLENAGRLEPGGIDKPDPLAEAINQLSNKIMSLSAPVQSSLGGLLGLLKGGVLGAGRAGGKLLTNAASDAVKLNKGFAATESASGVTRYRNLATGRFASAADAIAKPSIFRKATQSIAKGTLAAGSKIKIGAEAIKDVTPSIIKKLALPLAGKAVGKTVLKSIPIVGAVAGVGFALSKLVDGDPVGAGLDAVSGLGGPLTAIPALIFSIARDLYSDVYGVHPESDPLVGQRMGIVKDGVKQAVMDTLKPAIVTKQANPTSNKAALQLPKQHKPANDNKIKDVTSSVNSTPASVPVTPNNSPGETNSPNTQPSAAPIPDAAPVGKSSISNDSTTPPEANPVEKNPVAMATPNNSPNPGSGLAQASERNEDLAAPMGDPVDNSTKTVLPSRKPTDKSDSIGVGNVPNPNYHDIDSFADQIYFSAAA